MYLSDNPSPRARATLLRLSLATLISLVQGQTILQTTGTVPLSYVSVQTSAPATNWNRDIGTCTCDLTFNQCDSNCCCDPDCYSLAEQNARMNCIPQNSQQFPWCSNYLSLVNWYGMVNGSSYAYAGGGLCVMFTNSAVSGSFYTYPGLYNGTANFTSQMSNAVYVNSLSTYDILFTAGTAYMYGNPIEVVYLTTGFTTAPHGYFTLPVSSGPECSDNDYVRMLSNDHSSCSRFVTSANCASGGTLDHAFYMNANFNISGNPGVPGSYLFNPLTDGTGITYLCADATTGRYASCVGGSATYTAATSTCSNSVVKAEFIFMYSATVNGTNPTLTQVFPIFYLGSVYVETAGSFVTQTFSTRFQLNNATETYKYSRSGSPGYNIGAPILAGYASAYGSSVSFIPDPMYGLSLLGEVYDSTYGFACPSAGNYQSRLPVTFGENTQTGCSMWLQYSDLANANCATIRAKVLALQTLTVNLLAFNVVGIFGNSSASNGFSDWVSVITSNNFQSNNDQDGKCTQLTTDVDLQFLYTPLGVNANPQYAIVGARYVYTQGTFAWPCHNKAACSATGIYQPFALRNSVSFVEVSTAGTSLYTPPAPQIWLTLPSDVWYPFNVPSS